MSERLATMRKDAADAFDRERLAIISASLVRAADMLPAHLVTILCEGSVDVEVLKTVVREGENAEERALTAMETLIHGRLMVRWRGLAILMARGYVQKEHPSLQGFLNRSGEGWAVGEDGTSKYWLTDQEVALVYTKPWEQI